MCSEWKKSDWRTTETWESVNCSSGDVTITKVVLYLAYQGCVKWVTLSKSVA